MTVGNCLDTPCNTLLRTAWCRFGLSMAAEVSAAASHPWIQSQLGPCWSFVVGILLNNWYWWLRVLNVHCQTNIAMMRVECDWLIRTGHFVPHHLISGLAFHPVIGFPFNQLPQLGITLQECQATTYVSRVMLWFLAAIVTSYITWLTLVINIYPMFEHLWTFMDLLICCVDFLQPNRLVVNFIYW